jgi:hypothetical protein
VSAKKEKTVVGIILGIIGRIFCVFMMFVCTWLLIVLLRGLYFPKKVATVLETEKEKGSILDQKMDAIKESKDIRKHFHNIDQSIFIEDKDPPLCLTCHGNLPHTKALEMRSLLNMHTYFIACEVCHIRKEPEDDIYYAWFDFATKKRIFTLKGAPGNYNAKIVPVERLVTGEERRLDTPLDEAFAQEFIREGFKWPLEKKAKAKAIIHERHTKSPVLCNECHAKNGYLPFADLHYTEKRADQLSGTEAAGMVARYIKFYLPTMFDPALAKKRKLATEKTEPIKADEDVFKIK